MAAQEQNPSMIAGHQVSQDQKASVTPASVDSQSSHPAGQHKSKWWGWVIGLVVLIGAGIAIWPSAARSWNMVSTDDAYVNSHVTFVAPRVAGQVAKVLVDDNNRVRKGDILVQLDKEPFQVQVNIATAGVIAAEADLVAARAQARAIEGQMRGLRFNLEHSIQDVNNQVALLHSKFATLQSQRASMAKAQADFERGKALYNSRTMSKEEFDLRSEAMLVAQARAEEALQGVYQIRASLGLPLKPENGQELTQTPSDLDQTFSTVKEAQSKLIQGAAQLGVTNSFNKSPKQMVADFYKLDPSGDIDRIYDELLKNAPLVKQSEAKLNQARRGLQDAELNLRYCDVVSEIDGVVTRRNVNPGNNIIVGQSIMAVRSLTDIWIDANFKETQLGMMRIGHKVDLEVDMYGSHKVFQGRITGFTMGTGSTLALLPPENATGNFVKVVQRLPVRIELSDYNPEKDPLFVGLSVTPYVHVNEEPTGPHAGSLLQPYAPANVIGKGAEKLQ